MGYFQFHFLLVLMKAKGTRFSDTNSICSISLTRIKMFSSNFENTSLFKKPRLTSTARFLRDEQVHIPSSNRNAAKAHGGLVALQIYPYGGLDNISPLPPNRRKHGRNGSRTVINQKLKRSRDQPLAWENEHL